MVRIYFATNRQQDKVPIRVVESCQVQEAGVVGESLVVGGQGNRGPGKRGRDEERLGNAR